MTNGASASGGKAPTPWKWKASIITGVEPMAKRDFPPIHPGEILLEEFLLRLGISQDRLAKDIGVTPRRVNEIVLGRRGISADTALRLGRFFGMEAQFWLNLQSHYDMEVAQDALEDRLDKEVRPFRSAA
jgi:addiction module HigA family antidote